MLFALGLFLAWAGLAVAEPPSGPPNVPSRMWQDPGPVQSAPDAPRVLLVYPKPGATLPPGQELTRYAGRVEPPDAEILIDGEPAPVFPGGVFTGLLKIPVGSREVVFTAEHRGRRTEIRRTIAREAEIQPPASYPPNFHPVAPVQPTGEFWLRAGSTLRVHLKASPGHKASFRIGESGEWQPMQEIRPAPVSGGVYTALMAVDASVATQSRPVEFRLEAEGNGRHDAASVEMRSALNVRRMPETERPWGEVSRDFATFLKADSGWERWGNWIAATPFPILERRGDRYAAGFGRGEKGFIEVESSRLVEQSETPLRLPAPRVGFSGDPVADRVEIEWNVDRPVAFVAHHQPNDLGDRLKIHLIGAEAASPTFVSAPEQSFFDRIELIGKSETGTPTLNIALRHRDLWGYGFEMAGPETLRLTVRARPRPASTPDRPLEGLRVMLDAGHGGRQLGAIGPSGLIEADVNLDLAARVSHRLRGLGASVVHVRAGDNLVALDERVAEAVAWRPDLFLSIHHNSVPLSRHPLNDRGPIAFYFYPHSQNAATHLASGMNSVYPWESPLRVKVEPFRVTRNISVCPSVLVECAFLSHPRDEFLLRHTRFLDDLADALARGVVDAVNGG